MRTVGLLLVSAIMIVPIAASQQWSRSFRGTALGGIVVGVGAAVAGLLGSFYLDVPPGPMIVFVTLGAFLLAAAGAPLLRRVRTG
jgi:zinc transport system permease protein